MTSFFNLGNLFHVISSGELITCPITIFESWIYGPFFFSCALSGEKLQHQLAVSCDIREEVIASMFKLLEKELCILNICRIFLIPSWIKAARPPLNWHKKVLYMTWMQRRSSLNCRKKYMRINWCTFLTVKYQVHLSAFFMWTQWP